MMAINVFMGVLSTGFVVGPDSLAGDEMAFRPWRKATTPEPYSHSDKVLPGLPLDGVNDELLTAVLAGQTPRCRALSIHRCGFTAALLGLALPKLVRLENTPANRSTRHGPSRGIGRRPVDGGLVKRHLSPEQLLGGETRPMCGCAIGCLTGRFWGGF
jgi:hypothetical protein